MFLNKDDDTYLYSWHKDAAADKARTEAHTRRDGLTGKREAPQAKVTALTIDAAMARGHAVEASSEFAAHCSSADLSASGLTPSRK
jgi:hypothetical protein